MVSTDEGGDAACWAHLVEPPMSDIGDRADVERFVRDFYRQAAMDDVLGPVFAAAGMNWNAHIETLVEFWSWQLFGERGYVGNPLRARGWAALNAEQATVRLANIRHCTLSRSPIPRGCVGS